MDPGDTRKRLFAFSKCPPCTDQSIRESAAAASRRHYGELRGHRNARKTHCPKGHPYDEENTYLAPDGARQCRTCNLARNRNRDPEYVLAAQAKYRAAHPELHRERPTGVSHSISSSSATPRKGTKTVDFRMTAQVA